MSKKPINLLLVSKENAIEKPEHDRIVKQLRAMGYRVAEGRAKNMANVRADVNVEFLPNQ